MTAPVTAAAPVALHQAALHDVLLRAGLDLADTLSGAIAAGRLGPRAYLRWIAIERSLCQAEALATATLAGRFAPPLDAWVREAGQRLRDLAAMATADLRRTEGMAVVPAVAAIDHWRDYLDLHAGTSPARVLGVLAVHGGALAPARESVSAVLELPFLAIRGATYLLHRRLQAPADHAASAALWRLAPDPAGQRDLLAGASHAAGLYRELLRDCLGLGQGQPPPRWRWPTPAEGTA